MTEYKRLYTCEACGRRLSFTYDQMERNVVLTCTCGAKTPTKDLMNILLLDIENMDIDGWKEENDRLQQ